jgi:hypothetical protein
MSHSNPQRPIPTKTPAPAGGMASPPNDPPAASNLKTPVRGQDETNQVPAGSGQALSQELTREAYEFGWQSRLQHDRTAASEPATFESVEQQLAQRWRTAHRDQFPWEAARAIAQDAWNQVQDAVAEGSQRKS